MESILHKLASKQLSTCVSIIIMFTYTILLNRDFACTCQSQEWSCVLYLVLPFFIVFFLTLWTNRTYLKVCRYTCASCCNNGCSSKCCCFLIFSSSMVVEVLYVGLLWVVFVLIDGDWFVCCKNDHSEAQRVLACKDAKNITKEEKVMISNLKNTSRIIGAGLLLGIIVVGILLRFSVRGGCCRKSKCCNRKFVYQTLILEEEEKVLEEELRKSAHDKMRNKVQAKIKAGKWEECFEVAEELIDESTQPENSEPNEEQQAEGQTAENQVTEEQAEGQTAKNQVTEEQAEGKTAKNQVTEEQAEGKTAKNQVTEEQAEGKTAKNQEQEMPLLPRRQEQIDRQERDHSV